MNPCWVGIEVDSLVGQASRLQSIGPFPMMEAPGIATTVSSLNQVSSRESESSLAQFLFTSGIVWNPLRSTNNRTGFPVRVRYRISGHPDQPIFIYASPPAARLQLAGTGPRAQGPPDVPNARLDVLGLVVLSNQSPAHTPEDSQLCEVTTGGPSVLEAIHHALQFTVYEARL